MIDLPAEEEWEEMFSVADPDKLMEMEVVALGGPFVTLEEKWNIEEHIQEMRETMANETTYTNISNDHAVDINKLKNKLGALSARCGELVANSLKDEKIIK